MFLDYGIFSFVNKDNNFNKQLLQLIDFSKSWARSSTRGGLIATLKKLEREKSNSVWVSLFSFSSGERTIVDNINVTRTKVYYI